MNFRSLIPFGRDGHLFESEPFSTFQRRMNRAFEDMFQHWSEGTDQFLHPRMDIEEKNDCIEVTAELPGVEEKDIEVELVNNILTIRGEKKREHKEESKNFQLTERTYGTFQRHIPLPWAADPESIEAHFDKGVLKVTCKCPPGLSEKARKIPVSESPKMQ